MGISFGPLRIGKDDFVMTGDLKPAISLAGQRTTALGRVVIFGGTGFIGTHLAQHLLREDLSDDITLVDVKPPRNDAYAADLQQGLLSGRVRLCLWDVRMPAPPSLLPSSPE